MAQAQNSRRVWFNGKRIYLDVPPRRGWCEECKEEGLTHIHHSKYGKKPLSFTKEVCPSCHKRKHPKERQQWEQWHNRD